MKNKKLRPVHFVIQRRRSGKKKEEVMFCMFFSSPGRCGSGGEGCSRSLSTGVTMANHGRFPARETDEQPG